MNSQQPPPGALVCPPEDSVATLQRSAIDAQSVTQHRNSQPPAGFPIAAVTECVPLTAETKAILEDQAEVKQRKEEATMRMQFLGGARDIPIPSFLFNTTFLLMLIAIFCVVALVLYAQALSVLAQVALIPIWLRYMSYGILLVLVGGVAIFTCRVFIIYFRLRTTRKILPQWLKQLNDHSNFRQLCALEHRKAVEHLLEYLQDYQIDETRLKRLRFTVPQLDLLRRAEAKLKDNSLSRGDERWIVDFKNGFQRVLDEVADECIRSHAIKVGLRTAALPLAMADTLVVLYGSVALVRDLCQIYNLKLGGFATVAVTGWAAIQSILAGRIGDSQALDKFNEDALRNTFGDHGLGVLQDAVVTHAGGFFAKLVGIVSRRAAHAVEQGVLQGVLISRLGKLTKNWLRMVD